MRAKVATFQILIIGVFLSTLIAVDGVGSHEEEAETVQKAIQDATRRHDERIKLAMVNGAKSSMREPKKSSKYSREIGRISNIYRDAYEALISSNKMNSATALSQLRQALPEVCQHPSITCNPTSQYRSANGSCNNLENSHWGTAGLSNNRVLPPEYEGADGPRGGMDGSTLPAPRNVTLAVHSGSGSTFVPTVTHMAAQFGQFLDHDITLTPVEALDCCANPLLSPDCWKIEVKPDDPFYRGRRSCLDFVRSTEFCFSRDETINREQMNAITAYIDGSVVYGSDEELTNTLRSKKGGSLVENSEYPGFLPWKSDVNITDGGKSVIAGDVRADEMPGLAVLQSLFLREHNRIANELGKLRSEWNDEKIFQETRRIIAAELQQITYGEFLPTILGHEGVVEHGVALPDNPEVYTTYDETVDATIFNSFATAAYRFGHTLVNGLIQLYLDNQPAGSYEVRRNYLDVSQVIANHSNGKSSGYHLILNGLIRQRSQAFDAEIHEDMTNYLFADVKTMIGHDLAARNIQRGRDHGLPAYSAFRVHCGLSPLDNWSQKPSEINQTNWNNLRSVYTASPKDIDLYTGGLSEDPVEGALSGPTFICLQALQFSRIMKGDRFFFTHQNQTGSFNQEQLVALRSRTFGDIICQNSELEETARNVFYIESTSNPMIPCDDPSRQMDLSLFAVSAIDSETTTQNGSAANYSILALLIAGILCSVAGHITF